MLEQARRETLVTTRSTSRTCRVVSRRDVASQLNLGLYERCLIAEASDCRAHECVVYTDGKLQSRVRRCREGNRQTVPRKKQEPQRAKGTYATLLSNIIMGCIGVAGVAKTASIRNWEYFLGNNTFYVEISYYSVLLLSLVQVVIVIIHQKRFRV